MTSVARYRIGELARMTGVSPRTIDFYTNQGLLAPAERSEGGHRFYDDDAPRRVHAIKALRANGWSLEQARARLSPAQAAAEVLPRAEHLREELRRIEREVADLAPRLAAMPPDADVRGPVERAVQTSMLCALALAHELATLLAGTSHV